MTVCIGAIADNGKSAIVVADNMVTFTTGGLQYQSDHIRHKKIYEVTKDIYILVAGDTILGDLICKSIISMVNEHLKGEPDAVILTEIVVSLLKQEYQKVRLQKLEEHLLRTRGMTMEDYKLGKFAIANTTTALIEERLTNRDMGVELIIAGLNKNDCYSIYTITNPGVEICNDVIGFNSIGSGGPHAMYNILGSEYTKELTKENVLDILEKAKQASEFAPGVGKNTDKHVLSKINSTSG